MRAHSSLAAVLSALLAPLSCVDVVHEDKVQALGGETPGLSPGPLHRPGQPCITCHGGSGPASAQLSVGGTVYATQGASDPAVGAQVQITDINGTIFTARTNETGNFYVTPAEWRPRYPLKIQVSLGSALQTMNSIDNRDGSCADCHQPAPGPMSAGPVYVNRAPTKGGM
jgi:hypothetical protein